MSFTTWAALRTAILDAIANHVAGEPCVGHFVKDNRTLSYKKFDDLTDLYEKTFILESLESAGDTSTRVSYGRYRRFKGILA